MKVLKFGFKIKIWAKLVNFSHDSHDSYITNLAELTLQCGMSTESHNWEATIGKPQLGSQQLQPLLSNGHADTSVASQFLSSRNVITTKITQETREKVSAAVFSVRSFFIYIYIYIYIYITRANWYQSLWNITDLNLTMVKIPDKVTGVLNCLKPSSQTMALGST
jgi:hypothetical protein